MADKEILVIKRFAWCGGCGEHTEQIKTPRGLWACPCGSLLRADGHIAEHKPQEVEKVIALTCPA